jgi:hypothetical protein
MRHKLDHPKIRQHKEQRINTPQPTTNQCQVPFLPVLSNEDIEASQISREKTMRIDTILIFVPDLPGFDFQNQHFHLGSFKATPWHSLSRKR